MGWMTCGMRVGFEKYIQNFMQEIVVDIGGTIILKWILKLEQGCLLDLAGPGQGPVTGCCKCGDEFSDVIQDTQFFHQVGDLTW